MAIPAMELYRSRLSAANKRANAKDTRSVEPRRDELLLSSKPISPFTRYVVLTAASFRDKRNQFSY
jgi:hypothetical protein